MKFLLCLFLFFFCVKSDVAPLTDASFESTIKEGLWLVKFVAPWCSHCKKLTPAFVSASFQTSVGFGSVDVTKETKLRNHFAIHSFPTIKLFVDGHYIRDYTGPRSSSALLEFARLLENFSIPTVQWTPQSLPSLSSALASPMELPSSPSPVSGFALRCGAACAREMEVFKAVAMKFFDDSTFVHIHVPEDAEIDQSPVVIALTKEGMEELHLFDSRSLHDFVIKKQWPSVTALDFARFGRLRLNAKADSNVMGVVTMAVDLSDSRLSAQLQKIQDVAAEERFAKAFKFGWVDGTGMFKRGFGEIGIIQFPRIVVFGSVNSKTIWANSNLNVTQLEIGLTSILSGDMPPMAGVDEKRRLLSGFQAMFDELFIFATSSVLNLAFVLILTFTGATIFFVVCYFFVLDVRPKPNRSPTPSDVGSQSDSTTEGTLRTTGEFESRAGNDEETKKAR